MHYPRPSSHSQIVTSKPFFDDSFEMFATGKRGRTDGHVTRDTVNDDVSYDSGPGKMVRASMQTLASRRMVSVKNKGK